MPISGLFIIAFFLFIIAAVSYFFAKTKTFSFALLLFYACNTYLSQILLYHPHPLLFYIIITLFLIFPLVCLILFALDVRYGLFCTDTTFIIIFVWLLIPAYLMTNIILYLAG